MMVFSSKILQKPSLAEGPGKVQRLYLMSCGFTGVASRRHFMEEQAPLNLPYGPVTRPECNKRHRAANSV